MEYTKCLTQLDEVLKQLDTNELSKIPLDIREAIEKGKDKEYKWKYDKSKKLYEQDLNRNTISILSYFNTKYLLNKEQQGLMEKIHIFNDKNNNIN